MKLRLFLVPAIGTPPSGSWTRSCVRSRRSQSTAGPPRPPAARHSPRWTPSGGGIAAHEVSCTGGRPVNDRTSPVFRDYDQKALDREYNNREKVADAAAWLARYASQSARARTELASRLDVRYGTHPGETLDIFLTPRRGLAPVHAFIHGGYWHRLDKADFSFVARAFQPAAAAGVVVHYPPIPPPGMNEPGRPGPPPHARGFREPEAVRGAPHRG